MSLVPQDTTNDAPEIKLKRWSITESKLRDVLLDEPFKSMLTPGQISEVFRMRGFIVGMRLRQSSSDFLIRLWRDTRRALKAERGIVADVPIELKAIAKKYVAGPTSVVGKRSDLETPTLRRTI